MKINGTYIPLFRPPFINGRPQDSDSVFWKKKKKKPLTPVFEEFSYVFFICIIFKKESPGVTKRGSLGFPWVSSGSLGFPRVPSGSLGFPRVPSGSLGIFRRSLFIGLVVVLRG